MPDEKKKCPWTLRYSETFKDKFWFTGCGRTVRDTVPTIEGEGFHFCPFRDCGLEIEMELPKQVKSLIGG